MKTSNRLHRSHRLCATLVVAGCILAPVEAGAVDPHTSWSQLPTGNGYGFAVYDGAASRVRHFTTRPYQARTPTDPTTDVAYDAYFGVRADGAGQWLGELPVRSVDYVDQSNVVRADQSWNSVAAETYVFSPWGLEAPAMVLALKVTNTSRATINDASAYALLNFHLGSGAPLPGTNGEHISWDNGTGSYTERGAGAVTLHYVPLGAAPAHHGASPDNPYPIAQAGGALVDTDDSGTRDDAVAGFQWTFGPLAPGASQWVAVLVTTADVATARAAVGTAPPDVLVTDEVSHWNAWRASPPAGLSPVELRVWRTSETVLRMGQVREPGGGLGQILAALPPGIWTIAWARDMAFATAALARMGHAAEAGAAIDFYKHATVGAYRTYVNHDYSTSVVRYDGSGTEWSDTNDNGPNIEFDGFGLALWAAHSAGRSDLDANATTLHSLTDSSGLIVPDSSIWEVHWNGQQKRFAYTDITAARGLCDSGDFSGARALRDALVAKMILPTGGIAGNLDELLRGAPARDAAVVEAIAMGLIDAHGALARATIAEFDRLRTPVGRGFSRNDDGGGYDQQEWVYIDLRTADALRRMGHVTEADALLAWVTMQADFNHGLQAELYHRDSADYVGSIPMVGFGAGAYILALLDRANAEMPDARCFPAEGNVGTATVTDGGLNGGSGPPTTHSGCTVRPGHPRSSDLAWMPIGFALVALRLRRMRKST